MFFSSHGLQHAKKVIPQKLSANLQSISNIVFTINSQVRAKQDSHLISNCLKFPWPLMTVANKECSIQIGMMFLQLQI